MRHAMLVAVALLLLAGNVLAQNPYSRPPGSPMPPSIPPMPQPMPSPHPGIPPSPSGMPYPGGTYPGAPAPYPRAAPGVRPMPAPGMTDQLRPAEMRQAQEWALPAASGETHLAPAPDGSVFLALTDGSRILRFDPRSQRFSEWASLPLPRPKGIAVDRQGMVWFAGDGGIGRLDHVTGEVRAYRLPSGGDTERVATDSRGGIWYTAGSRVGRLETATGQAEETPLPGPPLGLVADRIGNAWVIVQDQDRVLKFADPGSPPVEISLGPGSQPLAHAIAQDGSTLWVLLGGAQPAVVALDTLSGQFGGHYRVPDGVSRSARPLAVAPRGDVWLAASGASPFLRLDPLSGASVPVTLMGARGPVQDLMTDSNGNLWYVSGITGRLGILQ